MSDQTHIQILSQGAENWNTWRIIHPDIKPDLSGAHIGFDDLSDILLNNVDLSGTLLNSVNLHNANLQGADLSSAELINANLRGANLHNASLIKANLRSTDLSEADLSEADLSEAILGGAKLNDAHLARANLSHANLSEAFCEHADFQGAILSNAELDHAQFSGANFSFAILSGASLYEAILNETHFEHASLRYVDFTGASLDKANLKGANLSKAIFHSTSLNYTNLSQTVVGWTIFGDIDLSSVKGLDTIDHLAPSEVSINTLCRSHGLIPTAFLRGTGISESILLSIIAFTCSSSSNNTCYICYCKDDLIFAQQLQADLQNFNVRCWLVSVEEDNYDTFWYFLDNPINLYDILIVILSEHSVTSSVMLSRIRMAKKKEHLQQKHVLIPIKLDETIMQNFFGPTALFSTQPIEPIEDFTSWQEPNLYQMALNNLLHNLSDHRE